MKKTLVLLLVILTFSFPSCRQGAQPVPTGLSEAEYSVDTGYPIQSVPFTEVTMTDDFWMPRMKVNAEVTIPHVIEKSFGARYFINNAMQAAIYSLQTYPNPVLQAQVDAYIQDLPEALRNQTDPANRFFELAAVYYNAAGDSKYIDIVERTRAVFVLKFPAPRAQP